MRKYKILGLTSGGLKGFSGVNKNLFNAISKKHELVGVIDNKLSGFWKYYNTLYCFLKTPGFAKYVHPVREIYSGDVAYYRFRTMYYVLKRTQTAEKALGNLKDEFDIVLQTGWVPAILKNEFPHVIYTDFTMKLSEKEYPPWSKFLSDKDKERDGNEIVSECRYCFYS